jgi:SagB-type dehydrogenase family enzyme
MDPLRAVGADHGGTGSAQDKEVPVSDLGPTRPFADVLAARHSTRTFDSVDVGLLGTVLARAALTRRQWKGEDGFPESSRPAASAGGRHPLALVVIAHEVTGLSPGAWVLDPDRAVLRHTHQDSITIDRATAAVGAALRTSIPPPAIVFAVANPARTLSRYSTGMSLVWRDTGTLLATLELAATDLGLASCIVGTCGVLFTPSNAPEGLVDTGALAVGGNEDQVPGFRT